MQLEPYLFFEGRCEEAVEFYRKALGAKVEAIMRYKDAPAGMPGPANVKPEAVMHARLRVGDTAFMASDGECGGAAQFTGFSLAITAANDAESNRVFAAIGEGGQVLMPLSPTFFATSFGMARDKFGVQWMVYAPIPQAADAERREHASV